MKEVRNYNIDFFRGIAALGVIFIHTCFWSGGSFVPVWLKSFALMIDVPLFIFISGMSFNFHKSVLKIIKSLLKFWKTYLVFIIIFFVLLFIFDRELFVPINLVRGIFFLLPSNCTMLVVEGSFWFIYMYFTVSIVSGVIIKIYHHFFKELDNFKYVLLLSFLVYGMKLYCVGFNFLDVQTLFYVFIYLLGYYLYNYKIGFMSAVIIEIVLVGGLYALTRFNDWGFMAMQAAKFEYHINYMVYSMIPITAVLFLKDRLSFKRKNPLIFMGQNALPFYFCQGLGTSFCYMLLEPLEGLSVFYKLSIMFVANIVITFCFVILLKSLMNLLDCLFGLVKKANFKVLTEVK